jgi:hypothetical protein
MGTATQRSRRCWQAGARMGQVFNALMDSAVGCSTLIRSALPCVLPVP